MVQYTVEELTRMTKSCFEEFVCNESGCRHAHLPFLLLNEQNIHINMMSFGTVACGKYMLCIASDVSVRINDNAMRNLQMNNHANLTGLELVGNSYWVVVGVTPRDWTYRQFNVLIETFAACSQINELRHVLEDCRFSIYRMMVHRLGAAHPLGYSIRSREVGERCPILPLDDNGDIVFQAQFGGGENFCPHCGTPLEETPLGQRRLSGLASPPSTPPRGAQTGAPARIESRERLPSYEETRTGQTLRQGSWDCGAVGESSQGRRRQYLEPAEPLNDNNLQEWINFARYGDPVFTCQFGDQDKISAEKQSVWDSQMAWTDWVPKIVLEHKIKMDGGLLDMVVDVGEKLIKSSLEIMYVTMKEVGSLLQFFRSVLLPVSTTLVSFVFGYKAMKLFMSEKPPLKKIKSYVKMGLIAMSTQFALSFTFGYVSEMHRLATESVLQNLNWLKAQILDREGKDCHGEPVFESQFDMCDMEGYVGSVAKLLILTVCGASVTKTPSGKKLDKFMQMSSLIPRAKDGIEGGLGYAMDLLRECVNFVRVEMLGLKPWYGLQRMMPEVRSWCSRVEHVVDESRTREWKVNSYNASRVFELEKEGYRFLQKNNPLSESNAVRTAVNAYMTMLRKLVAVFDASDITGLTPKMESLGVFICGETSSGKSSAAYPLIRAVQIRVLPEEELPRFRENPNDFMSVKNSENGYFDAYRGQHCVVLDDYQQLRSVAGDKDSEHMDIIRMINRFPYHPHMAALENKGTTVFNSKIVLVTSNLMSIKADALNYPAAVARRFNNASFKVVVKQKYAIDQEEDRNKRRIDPQHTDLAGNPLNFDVYEFHKLKWENCVATPTGEIFSFDETVEYLVTEYKDLERRSGLYNDRLDNLTDKWIEDRLKGEKFTAQVRASSKENELEIEMDDLEIAEAASLVRGLESETDSDVTVKDARECSIDELMGEVYVDAPSTPDLDFSEGETSGEVVHVAAYLTSSLVGQDNDANNLARRVLNDIGLFEAHLFGEHPCYMGRFHERVQNQHVRLRLLVDCIREEFPAVFDVLEELCSISVFTGNERRAEQIRRALDNVGTSNHYSEVRLRIAKKLATGIEENWKDKLKSSVINFNEFAVQLGEKVANKIDGHMIAKGLLALGVVAGVLVGAWKIFSAFNVDDDEVPSVDASHRVTDVPSSRKCEVYVSDPTDGKVAEAESYGTGRGEKEGGKKQWRQRHGKPRGKADENHRFFESGPEGAWSAQHSDDINELRIYPGLDVFTAQGGGDINSITLAKSLVRKNVYRLYSSEPGFANCGFGSIAMLTGRIAMMPGHYRTAFRRLIDKGKLALDSAIILKNDKNVSMYQLRLRELLEVFEGEGSEELGARDLCLVRLPQNVRAHADITGKFLDANTLKKPLDLWLNLCVLEDDGGWRIQSGRAEYRKVPIKVECKSGGEAYYDYSCTDAVVYFMPTLGGDCGSLSLISNTSIGPAKIVGMHVAGFQNSMGAGAVVSREMLQACVQAYDKEAAIPQPKVPIREVLDDMPYESQFQTPIGKAEIGVTSGGKTVYVKSRLYGAWGKALTRPAFLHPVVRGGVVIDPRSKSLKDYCLNRERPNLRTLQACSEFITSKLVNLNTDIAHRRPGHIFSYEESCAGIAGLDFCDGIPRDTSPGYPFIMEREHGYPGKTWWFGKDGPYVFSSPQNQALRDRVEDIIDAAKEGKRLVHIYMDVPKDERRPSTKVEELKTRSISACPMDLAIAFRQYFLDFNIFLMQSRIINGCCVGINPRSAEWDLLARTLNRLPHKVAGDFSGFDKRHLREFLWAVLDIINNWYDDGDENRSIRKILWFEVVDSIHIFLDNIIQWDSSLPSGHPLTAIINSLIHLLYVYYAFVELSGMGIQALAHVDEHVQPEVYGDDGVYSISDDAIAWFNQNTITDCFAKIGLVYTDELKTGERAPDFRTLEEVSFLKRAFRFDKEMGMWLAPLALETVLEMPYWTKNKADKELIVKDNVRTALMELGLHEKAIFERWSKPILSCSRARIGYCPPVSSYEGNLEAALSCPERW